MSDEGFATLHTSSGVLHKFLFRWVITHNRGVSHANSTTMLTAVCGALRRLLS